MSATTACSRGERSCAAPAARPSRCPGWRRWPPRRAQAATGAGQALRRDVLGQRHDPVGLDADAGTSETDFTLSPILAPLAAAPGRHRRDRRPRAAGRRRRRPPERHRRHADRPAAQRRARSPASGAAPAGWPMGPSVDQRIAEGLARADQAALAGAGRAGRRRRQLGAHDLPRRQPAAAARRRSGQRLRARVLRPAHRPGGAGAAARAAQVDPRRRRRAVLAHRRRGWAPPTASGWTRT